MARKRDLPRQAHDHLFKLVCSTPGAAQAVARAALREQAWIVDDAEPGSFQPVPPNEVDEYLGEDFRDVVFACRLRGRETLIFFLIEHQRAVDRNMPLRAYDYVRAFWAGRRLRAPDQPLPLALAIVVHQGDGPWTGPLSIADMLDAPAKLLDRLGSYVPGLRLALLDLGKCTPGVVATLDAPPLVRVALTLMRVVVIPGVEAARVLEVVRVELAGPLQELMGQPGGTHVLRIVVRYALGQVRGLDAHELGDAVRAAAGSGAGEVVMSTAQELIEQGILKLLRSQLEEKFGSLPAEIDARLGGASARQLETWGRRVLSARKLADVFDSPTPPRAKRPGSRRGKRQDRR